MKNPEKFFATIFFAVFLLVIAYFAFSKQNLASLSIGIFWLVFCLTSFLAFHRSLIPDELYGFNQQMKLGSVSPSGIFLAKFLFTWVYLSFLHLTSILWIGLLFNPLFIEWLPSILGLVLLVNFGQTAVSLLVAEQTFAIKFSEFLFPLLNFPIILPLLLAAIRLNESLLNAGNQQQEFWLELIILYDVLFFGISLAWSNLVD